MCRQEIFSFPSYKLKTLTCLSLVTGVHPIGWGCPWHRFECGREISVWLQCLSEPLSIWQQCLLVLCHHWLAWALFLVFVSAQWAQRCTFLIVSTYLSTNNWMFIWTTFSKYWCNTREYNQVGESFLCAKMELFSQLLKSCFIMLF